MVNSNMEAKSIKITPIQYMFTIACFIQSSALLATFFVPIIGTEAWLSLLVGMSLFIPVALIHLALSRRFPGKNLIEIFCIVLGRVGGAIFSLLAILFFATLTTLNLRDLGFLAKQAIMSNTPAIVLTSLCVLVCAYAVYHGLGIIVRYSFAFTLLSAFVVILVTLLTLPIWKLENFLPMFQQPAIHYIQSAHIASTIPSAELLVFLMIMPNVKRSKKGLTRYFFGGYLIGGLTILLVIVRDTAVLGNIITFSVLPPFETQRLATMVEGLNRLEILYIIVMIVLWFFKITVHYYGTVTALAQLFKLKSYHPLILVMGAFFVTYAIYIFPSIPVHMAFAREEAATIWLFITLVPPLVTLIIAYLRRLPGRERTIKELDT